MVCKKYWETHINNFINILSGINKEEQTEILGIPFRVFPSVFSPIHSSDTVWFAKKIVSLVTGKKFLEIGSGSGIIACLASIYGASQVIATDVNPKAVENILFNARAHSLKISARLGNVFDPITRNEKFDIIFWNHPFYCTDKVFHKDDVISTSVYDTNYQKLTEYLLNGKSYLANNGILILGTSNIAKIKLIKEIAKAGGYKTTLLEKTETPVYKGNKTHMDLRVYSFQIN